MRIDPRVPLPNFGMQPVLESQPAEAEPAQDWPEIPAAVDMSQLSELPTPEQLVPVLPQVAPGMDMAPGPAGDNFAGSSRPETREYVTVPSRQEPIPPHPWKVTSEGADTVAIAAGQILTKTYPGTATVLPDLPFPMTYEALSYAGETGLSAGAGYLYARCEIDGDILSQEATTLSIGGTDYDWAVQTVLYRPVGTPVVVYLADPVDGSDGEYFYVLIATLTKPGTDIVVEQNLFHNPDPSFSKADISAS